MTTTNMLPTETKAAKRSTSNGEPVTVRVPGTARLVPSYVAATGKSVDAAAKSLGLRVLGRRETFNAAIAEIHERGGQSYFAAATEVRS